MYIKAVQEIILSLVSGNVNNMENFQYLKQLSE